MKFVHPYIVISVHSYDSIYTSFVSSLREFLRAIIFIEISHVDCEIHRLLRYIIDFRFPLVYGQ